MNIHHLLFFCCFSAALCGGNTRLVGAQVPVFTQAEGETASLTCYQLSSSESRKFFCKNKCEAEDILINTDGNTALNGRYSIEYRSGSSGGELTVTFTNLTRSDSGRYRCGLGETLYPDSYCDFEVRVSDAPLQDGISGFSYTTTEGENITFGCDDTVYGRHKFLCKDECKKEEDILIETDGNRTRRGRYSIEYNWAGEMDVTITQVTKSDTGRYMCGYGRALSPDSSYTTSIVVIDAPTTFQPSGPFTGSFVLLVVGVPFFVLLDVFLLLYKLKKQRNLGLNTRGNADDVFMEESVMRT